MTPTLLYALAVLVVLAVVNRLASLHASGKSLRCHVTWNLWVLGQVAIATGAMAVLAGWPDLALILFMGGLALSYTVRIYRRSTDR